MNGIDIAIERYKDNPRIEMIKENVSFESCFSFKGIHESDIQKIPKNRGVCKYYYESS